MTRVKRPGSTASNLKEPEPSVVMVRSDAGRGVFESDGGGGDVGAVGVLDDADDRAGGLRIEGGWQRGGWERARRDGDVGGWSVWEGDFMNAG